MTRADQLRSRANELEGDSDEIRWTHPTVARHLNKIAREMRQLADTLPPERGNA